MPVIKCSGNANIISVFKWSVLWLLGPIENHTDDQRSNGHLNTGLFNLVLRHYLILQGTCSTIKTKQPNHSKSDQIAAILDTFILVLILNGLAQAHPSR